RVVRHAEAPPASDSAPINLKNIRLLQAMMIAPESPYRSPVPGADRAAREWSRCLVARERDK
ncbi:hypothetical protein, partial [Paraburkholderia dipogonis]|uniref:hypothetical protein n=1 Tax=Paraburkholderia dipogonis TaxID=1211383 RepID=UPI003613F424